MRNLAQQLISNAQRSGDRFGVDGMPDPSANLGVEVIRLARLATSIHLAEAARTLHGPADAPDHPVASRESFR